MQVETEINELKLKIDEIEQMLKKPFKEWTEGEIEEFGTKEQLRDESRQLRRKEEQAAQRRKEAAQTSTTATS